MSIQEATVMDNPLFQPKKWREQIDKLTHGLLRDNVFLAVFAPPGGGKTSFARLLHVALCQKATVHFLDAHKETLTDQFLRFKEGHFSLIDYIKTVNQQRKHTILLIDNASVLPLPIIEALLLQVRSNQQLNYFHICLLADLSFKSVLQTLCLECQGEQVRVFDIPAWSRQEIMTYTLKKYPFLTPQTLMSGLDQFCGSEGAFIASVNTHLPLLFNKSDTLSYYKEAYILAGCIFITFFSCVYIWKNQNYLPFVEQIKTAHQIRAIQSQLLPFDKNVSQIFYKSQIPVYRDSATYARLMQAPLMHVIPLPSEDEAFLGDMAFIDKVIVIPKQLSQNISQNVASTSKKNNLQLYTSYFVPFQSSITHALTIQLIASQQLADIRQYIHKYKIQEAHIRLAKRNGVLFYVLTMGEYLNKEQALSQLQHLPQTLKVHAPFIRPLRELALA